MRRRERGNQSRLPFGDEHAARGFDRDDGVVDDAAELMMLRMAAGVVPRDARREIGREPLQSGFVLVRDPRFVRARHGVHPQQVCAAIRREAKASGEDAHRQTGERDLEAGAIALHAARRRLERRGRALDVGRRARRSDDARGRLRGAGRAPRHHVAHLGTIGHHERRIPERIPPVLLDHFRRQRDAGVAQWLRLLLRHAADAARHAIFGNQILSDHGPLPACFADRKIAHHRLTVVDPISRA